MSPGSGGRQGAARGARGRVRGGELDGGDLEGEGQGRRRQGGGEDAGGEPASLVRRFVSCPHPTPLFNTNTSSERQLVVLGEEEACVSVCIREGCARLECSAEGQVLVGLLKLGLLGRGRDTGLKECTPPPHTHRDRFLLLEHKLSLLLGMHTVGRHTLQFLLVLFLQHTHMCVEHTQPCGVSPKVWASCTHRTLWGWAVG